ncbi:MAG: hypothetical protein HY843_02535 [Bdellovibrio sp.]|nr:hypothetical protein [Bdellovibrio sp.]
MAIYEEKPPIKLINKIENTTSETQQETDILLLGLLDALLKEQANKQQYNDDRASEHSTSTVGK